MLLEKLSVAVKAETCRADGAHMHSRYNLKDPNGCALRLILGILNLIWSFILIICDYANMACIL